MATTKTKTKTKIKSSSYLCCFGISSSSSLPHKTLTESNIIGIISDEEDKNLKQKSRSSSNRWLFPWKNIRVRVKGQSTKTMPLEGSESDEKDKYLKLKGKANNSKVHHSSKWKSKSNLHNKTTQHNIIPITLNQNSSESQQTPSSQNSEKANVDNDTCQKSSSPPPTRPATTTAMSHAVSLPTSKRQVRRLLSSLQAQPQTTQKQPTKHQNAKGHYNAVVGACVVMLTLVIMILWGRFCAIACTSMWLYFVPRYRLMNGDDDDENDVVENGININSSNDLDLDSVVYKKKVVLEGLLERNHSGVL